MLTCLTWFISKYLSTNQQILTCTWGLCPTDNKSNYSFFYDAIMPISWSFSIWITPIFSIVLTHSIFLRYFSSTPVLVYLFLVLWFWIQCSYFCCNISVLIVYFWLFGCPVFLFILIWCYIVNGKFNHINKL